MNTEKIQEKPSFSSLWQDIKKYKKLHYKVLGATFVISAIIMLSIPNYYKCTVMLAPEIPGGNKGSGGLASLASSFGVNLNSSSAGADAIMPNLYPDLMNSVTFRASLFPIKVQREDQTETMTYYDYLKDGQKAPWWSIALKAAWSIFAKPEPGDAKVNTFKLTKEQTGIIQQIGQKVVCDVDKKTAVITIDVTDQDPLIAATMADSVQHHLQEFITEYRTKKARVDLAYNQKLYKEAQARYEKARLKSAAYADANRHALFARSQSEIAKLENELQLQLRTYTQVAAQLQMAEAKVQEDTPAFTTLQPATVPIQKEGPKRTRTVLIFLFLAFLATTAYSIHKEGHLIPLLFPDDEEEEESKEITVSDLARLLKSDKE